MEHLLIIFYTIYYLLIISYIIKHTKYKIGESTILHVFDSGAFTHFSLSSLPIWCILRKIGWIQSPVQHDGLNKLDIKFINVLSQILTKNLYHHLVIELTIDFSHTQSCISCNIFSEIEYPKQPNNNLNIGQIIITTAINVISTAVTSFPTNYHQPEKLAP